MTMGMSRRSGGRAQALRRVMALSDRGSYYATNAGGAPRGLVRTSIGVLPTLPGIPGIPGFPSGASIPGIDQFLQGAGTLLGSLGIPAPTLPGVPGLPNFQLPPGMGDLLATLPVLGMFTPWAAQIADDNWQEIASPTANIAVSDIGQVTAILDVSALGRPGFIAILAEKPVPGSQVALAFQGSPYQYAGTQAVYSQQDTKTPPKILFVHWGSLRDPSDPNGGSKAIGNIAPSLGGKTVFALPVAREQTTSRQQPTGFETAYRSQFGGAPLVEPAPVIPQTPGTLPSGVPQPTTPPPTTPTPGTVQPGQPVEPGKTEPSPSQMATALKWGGIGLVAAFGVTALVFAASRKRR